MTDGYCHVADTWLPCDICHVVDMGSALEGHMVSAMWVPHFVWRACGGHVVVAMWLLPCGCCHVADAWLPQIIHLEATGSYVAAMLYCNVAAMWLCGSAT